MNDIENEAKPFLTPMVQGRGRTLYDAGQTAVTKWATLKTLVAQGYDPDMPRSHYPALYRDRIPPTLTQVWVGALNVDGYQLLQNRSLRLQAHERPGTPVFDGYGTTMTVGHLVLNVFGIEGEDPMRRVLSGRLADCLKPIWPIGKPVEWPPEVMTVSMLVEAAGMY
jgi:hypothetical protein